jgi:hypothetical protein
MARIFFTAITLCGVFVFSTIVAAAQEMPDPAPTVSPGKGSIDKPISLSLVPALTLNTGSDVNPNRSYLAPYSVTALGFRFGYDITNRLTAYWNRGTPISLNGRYYNSAGVPVYGNLADDINDSYGVSYAATKTLAVDAGYTRRWRINVPAAGDPANANPSFYSGAFIGTAWRFGPDTRIGKPFTLYATVTDVDHLLNAAAPAPATRTPGWQILCTNCGLSVRLPVFNQSVFIPRAGYVYTANYAVSSAYPPIANALEYGADIVPAAFVTFNVTVRNFNGHKIGFPIPTPQDQHYSYVAISATFRVRASLPR